ncbi:hypothetical protein [Mesorhizobium sp. CA4]|uniref:hypothetical protein n=1 Tax=Mesorhizobium sp. CA4 TaxID=588499 RepID=UPI001CD0CFAA|nr:hypothetical protein [Mesorhizobium sp. CA4]MBZ9818820.1 hypothetical protein [Mesorhizobium sp. CA4]
MRVHLHALLFIEYPFNISTFFIEMQLLVEIWKFRGGKFDLARAGKIRKIRVLIEEAERQFSGRVSAPVSTSQGACADSGGALDLSVCCVRLFTVRPDAAGVYLR